MSNVIFKIPLLDEWFLSSRSVLFFEGPYMWLLAVASERRVVQHVFFVFDLNGQFTQRHIDLPPQWNIPKTYINIFKLQVYTFLPF